MRAVNPVRRSLWLAGLGCVNLLIGVGGCGATGAGDPGNGDGAGLLDIPSGPAMRCIPAMTGDAASATISYSQDIVPMLARAGCLTSGCHSGSGVSSGYSLATYEGLFGPGEQAEFLGMCNVVPGDPEACYLLHKLSEDVPLIGSRMPATGLWLADDDYALLQAWILDGAPNN